MPPINDSGYELVLGPDADGRFVTVAQGEKYEHPAPPKTVSELEAEAAEAAKAAEAGATADDSPAPSSDDSPAQPARKAKEASK